MGRLSTRMPFKALNALLAPSSWAKVTVAIPRLTPPGPYETSTRLIGPTEVLKYSYGANAGQSYKFQLIVCARRRSIRFSSRVSRYETLSKASISVNEHAVSVSVPITVSVGVRVGGSIASLARKTICQRAWTSGLSLKLLVLLGDSLLGHGSPSMYCQSWGCAPRPCATSKSQAVRTTIG